MLATYTSCRAYWNYWTKFGVCWPPTGLARPMDQVGCSMLATYRSAGPMSQVGCSMLATYRSCRAYGSSFVLYVGNLQVLQGLWAKLGAVCWQPTGLAVPIGPSLVLYVGNPQVLQGLWAKFGAVCWKPTGLAGPNGPSLVLYIGNLHVLWSLLDRVWVRLLAAYRSCRLLGQTTGLIELPGQVRPCVLWTYWSYESYEACWTEFAAVCWQNVVLGPIGLSLGVYQPAAILAPMGPSLGLYVSNLQVV